MGAQRHAALEFRKAHKDDRQKSATVPLVVQEDMQMRHHVRVEQMGLVEQKHRVHLISAQLVDMPFDGEEQVRGARGRLQSERVAELAVEVAPAERRVMAVGQAESGLG
ncbi:hypothetical protein SCE1572_48020 [Sorangium cellulosum So0157-2]|uniref:Uncharacterized protein n=1 Tax=Sorangium cellulosum So0157-2 TaxID=1254432 RepID=S4YB66_SORCE|nr:hypothetical protein SCE1572_48020 [Sorangium cellulosum So0157-2]